MGNEASMEGEGQAGQPGPAVPAAGAPTSISAPPGSGQLLKPSNGAPAGGSGAAPRPGINRYTRSLGGFSVRLGQTDEEGCEMAAWRGATEKSTRLRADFNRLSIFYLNINAVQSSFQTCSVVFESNARLVSNIMDTIKCVTIIIY